MTQHIGIDAGGWYVAWYDDDDGGSGYGDEARVVRWYGDPDAVEARAAQPAPRTGWYALDGGEG